MDRKSQIEQLVHIVWMEEPLGQTIQISSGLNANGAHQLDRDRTTFNEQTGKIKKAKEENNAGITEGTSINQETDEEAEYIVAQFIQAVKSEHSLTEDRDDGGGDQRIEIESRRNFEGDKIRLVWTKGKK